VEQIQRSQQPGSKLEGPLPVTSVPMLLRSLHQADNWHPAFLAPPEAAICAICDSHLFIAECDVLAPTRVKHNKNKGELLRKCQKKMSISIRERERKRERETLYISVNSL
jgi:hypothetical protein